MLSECLNKKTKTKKKNNNKPTKAGRPLEILNVAKKQNNRKMDSFKQPNTRVQNFY